MDEYEFGQALDDLMRLARVNSNADAAVEALEKKDELLAAYGKALENFEDLKRDLGRLLSSHGWNSSDC